MRTSTRVRVAAAATTIAAAALCQPSSAQPRSDSLPHLAAPAAMGTVGAAAGAFGLAWVGYQLGGGGEIVGDDPAGLAGGYLGFVIGEWVGMAVGTHLGDRRHGNLAASLGAALGSGLALTALIARLPEGAYAVAIPLGFAIQLGATITAGRGLWP